ncbi:MAG: hypothetical protein E7456_04180 [Ruminococcaceae bacterium]|nr:hypothetical protein [Oscillospiraceae bacterium]
MKHLTRILSIILVLTVFAGSFVGSWHLFNQGTYEFDSEDLAVFDENLSCYYLQKVDRDIIFRVRCEKDSALSYSLVDDDNNSIQTNTQKAAKGCYDILPPSGGYEAGVKYTLSLPDGVSFEAEDLKDARSLVFSIDKEAVEKYEFTDAVVKVDTAIEDVIDNTLNIGDISVNAGDIIFGQDANNEYVVYKVTEVNSDGTATVTDPAIDEIYSDLEVYGEYVWDVDDIVSNPDLEIEIIENVKQSSFFSSLMLTAYAAETPRDGKFDVKITPDNDKNSIEIEITITLEPGENGLFGIGELRNQQVSITLSAEVGLSTKCNIQGITNWDLSAAVATDFSWEVDISLYTDEWKKDSDLEGLFSEKNKFANLVDYHKNVKKITEKLNNLTADVTGGEIKLFDWKLPIPSVPGLYFSTEIKLFAKLDVAADVTIGQSNETVYTVGICFIRDDFEAYSNTYRSSRDITLSLSGKAKAKAGIKLVIKATLINDKIANINLDPQVGLYADLYVTFPISELDEIDGNNFLYSYFEPGVYFGANINATLNVLVKKFEFSYELVEKKFPIDELTFGNKKIAMGLSVNASTVRAVDKVVSVPDILFEYFDVKGGNTDTEKLSLDDVKFVANDGTKLKVDNGKITLPDATASSGVYITATYLHTDGKTYSTTFRVLISGSVLEGKVSAYDTDASTSELEGATVKLYSGSNTTTPLSTIKTDESGKFSFNIAKGNYTLVISADGYRTLTSSQTVADDEIKYTEHILLMDNSQSGLGSAGGTVMNALDGKGLSNVTIKLRNDWNNTSGPYCEYETTTSSSGRYTIENMPVGYYTVEASRHGYVTGYTNIIVLSDAERSDFDFTITPTLNEDEIRIVLTWGSSPSDLDSHLIGRTPSNGTFNVYYSDKEYHYDGVEMANLDVDDTSSYGPETITILENIYGTYTYAVHNYSNRNSSSSTALSFSGAVVRVFVGSVQVAEYNVPTDQVGTYWTVFEIARNGRILPINTISNTKPAA